jgi:hypothetical protein
METCSVEIAGLILEEELSSQYTIEPVIVLALGLGIFPSFINSILGLLFASHLYFQLNGPY